MRADNILSLKVRGLKDWLSTTIWNAFSHPFEVYGLKPAGEILQVERLKVASLIDMWSCYTLPKILPKCSGFLITPQYSYVTKNLYRKTSQSEILTYYIWESWCESEATQESREIRTTKTKNIVLAFLKNRNVKSYNIKFLYKLSK